MDSPTAGEATDGDATDGDATGEASSDTDDHTGALQMLPDAVRVDAKRALLGGGLAALVTLAGAWLVGSASGAEARVLLETALPRARSFCGTVTIALGNVLALMLTLLSMSSAADVDLKWAHYQRVKQIAFIDALTLIGAILFYLLLNVPLVDAEAAEGAAYGWWFQGLYYACLVLTSLLGGALISIVLMLYNTVRDIIRALGPSEEDSRLVEEEKKNEEEGAESNTGQTEREMSRA